MEIMDTRQRPKRRHRHWPEALKREIVAAAAAPGASVSQVARQYDVNTNLVFTWRRQCGEQAASGLQMMPVVVAPEQPTTRPASTLPAEFIEIELPQGYRVRIVGSVKTAALRAVLDAVDRR
jgi:transposase